MSTSSEQPRQPDGRRGGPVSVGEPVAEDRQLVENLRLEAEQRRAKEAAEQAEAAEPAGVPPSDEQRAAVDKLRERSAELRAPAARALRRTPVAIGTVYDDERDQVADLHAEARERRLDELANRGIVDPTLEAESAGFPAELPHLPGHELYGNFECPNCGANVERAFPGYIDWDLASRDLVCSQCGGVVLRGQTGQTSEDGPTATDAGDPQHAPETPPGVQTSAQDAGGQAQPLSDAERAELEQLRAERAAREHQVDGGQDHQGDQAPEQQQSG